MSGWRQQRVGFERPRLDQLPVSRAAWFFPWPILLLAVAVFLVAYWPALLATFQVWNSDPDYSHGYLILPLALALLWKRRARFPEPGEIQFDLRGLVLVALAGAIRIVSARFYLPELDIWSIPVWLGGFVWAVLGWRWFAVTAPCLAFLWFAAPLPATLDMMLSAPLQRFAATAAGACLVMLGQPAVVEGTTVLLGDHIMDVERACSGLRLFFGVAALSVAYVMLTAPGRWRSCLLLFATVPVAIFVNLLRIVVTGLLFQYTSSAAARSFTHDFAGIVMIPVAVLLFFIVLATVNRASRAFVRNPQRAVAMLSFITLLLLVVASIALMWHQRQQRRAFTTLLVAANRSLEKEQWDRARALLRRYVAARPQDSAALIKLAEAVKKTVSPRVAHAQLARIYERVWKLQPANVQLGRRYVTALMRVGDYRTALEVLNRLQDQAAESDAELQRFCVESRAQCIYASLSAGESLPGYSWSDAADALQDAVAYDAGDRRFALQLAIVQREHLRLPSAERRPRADATISKLVTKHPTDPHAWLVRYEYARRYWRTADPAAIDDSLDRALALARQGSDAACASVFYAAARVQHALADFTGAKELLGEAISASLGDLRGYAVLAEVLTENRDAAWWEPAMQALDDADDYLRFHAADTPPVIALPDWERAWFMAQYYRATGQVLLTNKALLDAWELSAQAAPPAERIPIATSAAVQFVGWSPKFAEACVRQALAVDVDATTPRYLLAEMIIDSGGDTRALNEAAVLLGGEVVLAQHGLSDRLRRLWARLLRVRNSDGDLNTAVKLLRGLADATASDSVSLAGLYERQGRPQEAWDALLIQANSPAGGEALYAAIDFWQRTFMLLGEQQETADNLYETLWNNPGGEMEVIEWKIRELAGTDASPEETLAHVRPWLKRYWNSVPSIRQESFTATLTVLAREAGVAAAAYFCENSPNWMPQREAWRQLLVVLPQTVGQTALPAQVTARIDDYLSNRPDDVPLKLAWADYDLLTGDYRSAAAHYVSVLSREPENLHALNNYSLTLCEGPADYDQALQTLQRALKLAPQDAGLLDTKALILVRAARFAEADQLLTQLVRRLPVDPLVSLHVAISADLQGRQREARDALLRAVLFDVEGQTLSPQDVSDLSAMRRKYDI